MPTTATALASRSTPGTLGSAFEVAAAFAEAITAGSMVVLTVQPLRATVLASKPAEAR